MEVDRIYYSGKDDPRLKESRRIIERGIIIGILCIIGGTIFGLLAVFNPYGLPLVAITFPMMMLLVFGSLYLYNHNKMMTWQKVFETQGFSTEKQRYKFRHCIPRF